VTAALPKPCVKTIRFAIGFLDVRCGRRRLSWENDARPSRLSRKRHRFHGTARRPAAVILRSAAPGVARANDDQRDELDGDREYSDASRDWLK